MTEMIITVILVSVAAGLDLKTRRIPNLLTMPAIAIAIIINFYFFGFNGLGNAVTGFFTGIMLFLIPFMMGGMGAGDVKLLAMIGALNGSQFVFQTFLYGAVFGGVIALAVSLLRGRLSLVLFNTLWALQNFSVQKIIGTGAKSPFFMDSNIRFPYGVAILAGTIIAYYMR